MTTYKDVIRAFREHRRKSAGNYYTDGEGLYLFGNRIAYWSGGHIVFTDAGYATATTAKALRELGAHYSHRQGGPFVGEARFETGSEASLRARKGYRERAGKRRKSYGLGKINIKFPKIRVNL